MGEGVKARRREPVILHGVFLRLWARLAEAVFLLLDLKNEGGKGAWIQCVFGVLVSGGTVDCSFGWRLALAAMRSGYRGDFIIIISLMLYAHAHLSTWGSHRQGWAIWGVAKWLARL